MCGPDDSASKKSQELSQQQFDWQKKQAKDARKDAQAKRDAMEKGLNQVGKKFDRFNGNYYEGIADNFRDYANPQVEKSQAASALNLQSALANRGKLGSSTDARQNADLVGTYAGIYRDTELKAQDYANQQRSAVAGAKQSAISQMYASESADAGLQAASGAVQSLRGGPSYEPVTALLAQASKFTSLDYGNSIYGGKSNGMFSPLFGGQAAQQTANPATAGSDAKTYTGS